MKWPYTYDSCDVGTAPNQTLNGEPITAVIDGDHAYGGTLSYLPGQRLSRCTCDGEEHPGPKHEDSTYVGRAAPEIDVFEAQVGEHPPVGQVSQSAQWAVSLLFTPMRNSASHTIIAVQHSLHLGQLDGERNFLRSYNNPAKWFHWERNTASNVGYHQHQSALLRIGWELLRCIWLRGERPFFIKINLWPISFIPVV